MIRLILFIGLIYGFFKVRKFWLTLKKKVEDQVAGSTNTGGKLDDTMIKDPFCEAYFPKREGVHLRYNGKDLYFCSIACKDKFIASQS